VKVFWGDKMPFFAVLDESRLVDESCRTMTVCRIVLWRRDPAVRGLSALPGSCQQWS
jgi:hypothetical protein